MYLRFNILILVSMSKERHRKHRNAANAGFAAFLNKSILVGFFGSRPDLNPFLPSLQPLPLSHLEI